MIVTILLGVTTLAVLVLAFLATKVWHWAHVLVLVAFYFASVGYAVLAARSLDTRLKYQKEIAKAEADFEQQTAMNHGLLRGTSESSVKNRLAGRDVLAADTDGPMPGTVDLEHQLRMKSRMRGRVWRFAQKLSFDEPTGMVEVGFPVKPATPPTEEEGFADEAPAEPTGPPPALGLEPEAIVYVFEQGPLEGFNEESGPRHYVGEFRVDSVEGRKATLESLDQLELDEAATERLVESGGPWIVYESMPADDRDLFADMDEETLRRLLPNNSVREYLRDRTPSTPDDPPERLEAIDADGNPVLLDAEGEAVATRYRRRLRDYTLLLNDLEARRAELVARTQAVTADIEKLRISMEGAEVIRAYREAEIAKWRADLNAVERDRNAIEQHVAALESQVGNARRLLEETLEENANLASFRLSERGVLTPFGSGALDVDAL